MHFKTSHLRLRRNYFFGLAETLAAQDFQSSCKCTCGATFMTCAAQLCLHIKLLKYTQYIYFLVDTIATSISSTLTSYPNSDIRSNNPTIQAMIQNTIASMQAQSTINIQASVNSLPIIIAIVACFAVVVTVAGTVCRFRNRRAKQGKKQQYGQATTIRIRTYENINEGIVSASECTKKRTKQQKQQNHHHQEQQQQPNMQIIAKHTNESIMHSPKNHHYENTANLLSDRRIKDAEIDGYIFPETIPQTSKSINGYEVPMKNADNIQELDGYVVMQSKKASSFPHGSYIEFNSSIGDLKITNQPQYESIPGCSH